MNPNDAGSRGMNGQVLKAGITYFTIVFAAGFVLGTIRELWLMPRLGVRLAELLEMPIMLIVIVLAACWSIQRFRIPAKPWQRLGVGLLAMGCLVAVELLLVSAMRQIPLAAYLTSRDPVSGVVYLAMLGVYALMPLWTYNNARSG